MVRIGRKSGLERIRSALQPRCHWLWQTRQKARGSLDAVLGSTHKPEPGTLRARYRAKPGTPGLLAKVANVSIHSREFSESWYPVSREVSSDGGSLLVVVAAPRVPVRIVLVSYS